MESANLSKKDDSRALEGDTSVHLEIVPSPRSLQEHLGPDLLYSLTEAEVASLRQLVGKALRRQ